MLDFAPCDKLVTHQGVRCLRPTEAGSTNL